MAEELSLHIPPCQRNHPVVQSPHFAKAEMRARVPFLYHKVLDCDYQGQEYTIKGHDITVRIPEGAVPVGKSIHFELAVSMYGPFKFPENKQPISPILWLCFEEDQALNKPFQVILPHFLTGLTKEQAQYHQVIFTKANHKNYSTENGEIKYSFQPCETEPHFASTGGRSFGVLLTNHCCFYCLQANNTQELVKSSGYCLIRIESSFPLQTQRSEVHFSAVYFLPTCLKVRYY